VRTRPVQRRPRPWPRGPFPERGAAPLWRQRQRSRHRPCWRTPALRSEPTGDDGGHGGAPQPAYQGRSAPAQPGRALHREALPGGQCPVDAVWPPGAAYITRCLYTGARAHELAAARGVSDWQTPLRRQAHPRGDRHRQSLPQASRAANRWNRRARIHRPASGTRGEFKRAGSPPPAAQPGHGQAPHGGLAMGGAAPERWEPPAVCPQRNPAGPHAQGAAWGLSKPPRGAGARARRRPATVRGSDTAPHRTTKFRNVSGGVRPPNRACRPRADPCLDSGRPPHGWQTASGLAAPPCRACLAPLEPPLSDPGRPAGAARGHVPAGGSGVKGAHRDALPAPGPHARPRAR